MNSRDINNREDIYTLVSTFYNKVKEDDFIGPIFLGVIPDEQWGLTFKSLQIFGRPIYFLLENLKETR